METKAATALQAAKDEAATQLYEMEAQGAFALRATNEASTAKIHEIEEGYQQASAITNDQLIILQNENTKLQQHLSRQLQMLEESEQERHILSESPHRIQTSTQQDWEQDREQYQQELEKEKNWIL